MPRLPRLYLIISGTARALSQRQTPPPRKKKKIKNHTQRNALSLKFWPLSYQRLLHPLIGPRGSDKYNPGDPELLLWISMLIGFQVDLTDLACCCPPPPPPKPHPTTSTHPQSRDSLEPGRGEGFCWGDRGGETGEKGKWVERVSGKGGRWGVIGGEGLWRSVEDIAN